MTPEETKDLAELLSKIPGVKGIEFKDVRRLTDLIRESPEIGSIELRGFFGTGVVITRSGSGWPMPPSAPAGWSPPPPPAAPGAAAPTVPAEEAPRAASTLKEIRSPMVGTYYASPEPGAESYVKVGSRVSSGQTVCIIEAMKIMNEIEAEVSGVVREVCVEDAQAVEFGHVLFRVDPNG
ncbi:MAG TPA: acetyl-CoA carboxylase biotin carboxyl carrier protein [Gemmatimonadales bacterium]|nr:acetyl-CoA carboxylase biotin carboxyl carrier protein [Gemmatimonadales bacterium]